MKPEQQRIKIAEACGYSAGQKTGATWELLKNSKFETCFFNKRIENATLRDCLKYLPDYLNDLNAMHEAEKTIRNPGLALWCEYSRTIRRICDESLYSEIHATAAQRAEAFLKTLGLWEGEP